MVITTARRQDLPQILELYKALFDQPFEAKEIEEHYDTLMADPNTNLLVVKDGDEVLGTCVVIVCTGLAEKFTVIEDVVVDENIRGRGIGKMIFAEVDRISAQNRCSYAILVSSGFRLGAHAFYEKMGYVDDVRGFRKIYF